MRRIAEFFKNNRKWNIALWSCISVFIIGSLLGINEREQSLRIRKIEIDIQPQEELAFLDSNKVIGILKDGDSSMILLGAMNSGLALDEMERRLETNPFIEEADVSVDLSGKFITRVLQRHPVMRVINQHGQSYYVAKSGYKMPLSPDYTPRVLVATGNISETLVDTPFVRSAILRDLLKVASYCAANKFWNSQIEQMYVDNYMDIILIPRVGNHTIVFGSAEDLEDKFKRLEIFYFQGLNNIGWDAYRKINLKYKGQVVAERDTITAYN